MVAALQAFLLVLSGFFLCGILLGLYRPVLVLWFLPRFNRRRVLDFYGKAFVVVATVWGILQVIRKMAI